jgi:selenocysteine lyase/cysteine desulfurase
MTTFSQAHLAQLRRDTPGAANRLHFNNAGAALMPRPVFDAIREHLELEMAIGGYEAAASMRRESRAFQDSVATLIGAQPHQIAYATNATDAFNKALSSIPFERGDVLLTTRNDYVSNQIAFLELGRRFGVKTVWAEDQPAGGVDLDHMAALIDKHRPRLVAVTHVPTNSGLVQPVAALGELCRRAGVLYLIDACQSAGQLPLDVAGLHCDFLSATFRKFLRGPRGAGFLFVSDRVLEMELEPLFLDLHSARWTADDRYEALADARRFELWERSPALLLGSRAAADYATNTRLPAIEQRVKALAARLREQLQGIDGIRVLDRGPELCGIVSLTAEGWTPRNFKKAFDRRHINTSLNSRNYARFDFEAKGAEWSLRASPHYYNTEEEVNTFVEATREIVGN